VLRNDKASCQIIRYSRRKIQTFQSRLAGDKWLTLHGCSSEQNARKGIKKLAVVTPAFVSDCLETLEEIAMEANHEFNL
jgi:ferrochelatase